MRKFHVIFGSTALALSMISTTSLPMAAYGQAGTGAPGTARPRMHRMLGVEAPWISIALRHQSELNLSPIRSRPWKKLGPSTVIRAHQSRSNCAH